VIFEAKPMQQNQLQASCHATECRRLRHSMKVHRPRHQVHDAMLRRTAISIAQQTRVKAAGALQGLLTNPARHENIRSNSRVTQRAPVYSPRAPIAQAQHVCVIDWYINSIRITQRNMYRTHIEMFRPSASACPYIAPFETPLRCGVRCPRCMQS
jgi:hypothetical protein